VSSNAGLEIYIPEFRSNQYVAEVNDEGSEREDLEAAVTTIIATTASEFPFAELSSIATSFPTASNECTINTAFPIATSLSTALDPFSSIATEPSSSPIAAYPSISHADLVFSFYGQCPHRCNSFGVVDDEREIKVIYSLVFLHFFSFIYLFPPLDLVLLLEKLESHLNSLFQRACFLCGLSRTGIATAMR
jgi:hypothetical protein